jgi:hypothetical protein
VSAVIADSRQRIEATLGALDARCAQLGIAPD